MSPPNTLRWIGIGLLGLPLYVALGKKRRVAGSLQPREGNPIPPRVLAQQPISGIDQAHMIEAGAPSTGDVCFPECASPTGGSHGRTQRVSHNASGKVKERVLRGSLALDALHLLARDVDRTSELVGLEHPAFHHILNRRRSEAQILGRFHYGDFHAVLVIHPNNLLAGQRLEPGHPQRIPCPVPRAMSPLMTVCRIVSMDLI